MIYNAKVLHLNNDVEEEVLLQIGGVELTWFVSVCPYAIAEGLSYPIELRPVIFDEYVISELANNSVPSISRVESSFAYVVVGEMRGACLKSGELIFEDDVLQRDFGYLDGKMVAMKIDRIDAEFLTC